jgi:sugar (pentulose or hexulose) kinase
VWEALAGDEGQSEPARLTGAIADAPIWVQIVADVLGIPLAPIRVADASALGAAILGHWALGNSKELEARHTLRLSEVFEPDAHWHSFYAPRHKAFQSLYRSLF